MLFYTLYQSKEKDFISVLKSDNFNNYFGPIVSPKPKPKWPTYLKPTFGKNLRNFLNISNFLNDDEREFVEYYLPIMMHRARTVGEYCQNHPEIFKIGKPKYLYWITRKGQPNIAWCCNYKVGSGTWTVNFLREVNFNANNPKLFGLTPSQRERARFSSKYGATTDKLPNVFQQPKTHEEKLNAFNNSIRFLVVRHPFTRLLSSYRNIIERYISDLSDQHIFIKVRKLIIKQYRLNPTNNTSEFPTFPEFVNYFINITEGILKATLAI
ncbi:hypothetical protein Anas_01152 [Armadillidium nasatum]|uniref:Carbohydrate sulfotransferase n=1 Tax=Armadillidium nasatum TaxID=96803 RepID=A0A5N5SWG9_9CRUS|nr:hypothetical protein Anas_01152 [Armadillidium nasatum]